MAKKTQGGKRKNAGRKPIYDKKIVVTLYVNESVVEKMGIENLKTLCYEALKKPFQNLKNF